MDNVWEIFLIVWLLGITDNANNAPIATIPILEVSVHKSPLIACRLCLQENANSARMDIMSISPTFASYYHNSVIKLLQMDFVNYAQQDILLIGKVFVNHQCLLIVPD